MVIFDIISSIWLTVGTKVALGTDSLEHSGVLGTKPAFIQGSATAALHQGRGFQRNRAKRCGICTM